jgi:hypothetical protein
VHPLGYKLCLEILERLPRGTADVQSLETIARDVDVPLLYSTQRHAVVVVLVAAHMKREGHG